MTTNIIGSAVFQVRGDDSDIRSVLARIPEMARTQGVATERVAASAFGAAGVAAGRAFGAGATPLLSVIGTVATSSIATVGQAFGTAGVAAGRAFSVSLGTSTAGLSSSIASPLASSPAVIGAIGTKAGRSFADNIRSGTANVARSIAAPLAGLPDIIGANGLNSGRLFTSGLLASADSIGARITNPLGSLQGVFRSIGSNSGRLFSTGVLGGTGGLPNSIAAPLGVLPSSFAGVGSSSGRSFVSAITSQMGSIVSAAQSTAGKMAASFINAGRSIGTQIRGDIGRGINYSIANKVTRAGSNLVGAAFNTKNLAEFDAASRKVSQLTKDQKGMEAAAAALSKELQYGVTSTTILQAGYETLSSGFEKTTDVVNILRPAIKATIASQGEAKLDKINDAITSVINSYKAWGYGAKDADKIINQISGTVDAGKIKYGEYAQQIGKAASVAAASGISFEDLNAAIAKATISGQLPESVLSGIPGIITNISKPTKAAVAAANQLGIEFNAGALKAKGLLGVMADISAATAKLPGAGRSEAIQNLFGSVRGKNIATAIINDPTGTQDVKQQVLQGNLDKNYNKASGGITFQQEALKNRVIELDIKLKNGAFGEVLAASMAIASRAVGGVISAIERLDSWYKSLDPGTQGIIRGFGVIGATALVTAAGLTATGIAIGLIGSPLIAGAAAAGSFALGLGSIALAAAPIAIPLLAVGAAVYELGKAFGLADSQAFVAGLTAVGIGLAALFGPAALSAIAVGTTALVTGFDSIAVAAGAALIPLLPWIAAAAGIAAALYGLYKVYEMFKPQVDSFVAGIVEGFKSTISAAGSWLAEVSQPFIGLIDWYAKLVTASWNFTGAAAKAWFGMWTGIGQGAIEYGRNILDFVVSWGSKVWGFFGTIAIESRDSWSRMWEGIKGTVTSGIGFVISKVSAFAGSNIDSFKRMATGIIDSIDKWLQSMGLLPKGLSTVTVAIDLFKFVTVGQFANALVSVNKFKDGAVAAFDRVIAKIKELIGFVTDIPNKIQGAADSLNAFGGQPVAKTGGKGSSIVATGYTPGEGDNKMEGGSVDYRGRRLTKEMPAIATRTTGAIKGIPDGAEVQITDPQTGRSTTARAIDRGPLQPGVDVDLTTQVFKNLGIAVDSEGMPKQGKVSLEIKVLSVPVGKVADKYDLGLSGGGYYKGGSYVGKYGKEIGDTGFVSGLTSGIVSGLKGIEGFFGGGKTVASPVSTKSIDQAISDVVQGLGNFGAPRPGRTHQGTDFNGKAGTPVVAPYDGMAEYQNLGRTGSAVIIKSLDGSILTRLLHLSDESKRFFASGARPVRAGEQVGDIGRFGQVYRDGAVTGSKEHVHVEMRINGKLEDPAKVLALMEKSSSIARTAPKVATTKSNQPFASRRVEDTTEQLSKIDNDLAEQQLMANPDRAGIVKLTERRKAAQKKLNRANEDAAKKRIKDQYKQSEKAAKAEIRQLELLAQVIDSEEKNLLSKVTDRGEVAKIKASFVPRRQVVAASIATLKDRYANNPELVVRLNKVDTQLTNKSRIAKTQIKPDLVTAPKIGDADSMPQRQINEKALSLNEASTKLANLRSQANPASTKELLNAENLVKKRTQLFDYAVIDAGKKREKDRAKGIEESAEKEVESIQAELSIIASNARLASSRIDRTTDSGNAEIVRIEANRVNKEKALISKVNVLRAKNSDNPKLIQQLNDIETNINENAIPKGSKDKLTDVGILEQQIKSISDDVGKRNQLTDLAVARGRVTKEIGAITKADRGSAEAKKLAGLLPMIADLKQKYLKNPEVTAQINALESRIVDKQSESISSSRAASGARLEVVKGNIDKTIGTRDRAIEAVKNNVLTGTVTQENADQAILSIQIKYNAELQKAIPLIKQFKATANVEDKAAADNLTAQIAKNNAETISAQKGDNLTTIKTSIDRQLVAQSSRSEEINNSLLNGEITQIEAQKQQLANRQIYNEELQKTLQTLEYIRSVSKGDAIAPVETEIRRVAKNNAETKSAETDYRKVEITEQFTKIDRIVKTGETRQSIAKNETILNTPDRDNTSFLDPNVAIEKQQAETMLTIRQQTAKELAETIPLLQQMRSLQTDPAEIERLNEKLAMIRQYQVDVKVATDAQEEADRASTVAAQATKQINEQLGTSFRDMFTDVFRGAKSLNSIFDNLLNKIADIGINAIFNQTFGNISGGGSGGGGILDGLVGIAGKIFGFSDGGAVGNAASNTIEIGNYSSGGGIAQAFGIVNALSAAMKREGAGAVPIVANDREYVLNPAQTRVFQSMTGDGTWAQMERVYNYSSGGAINGNGAQSIASRSVATTNTQPAKVNVVVDRINSVDYVSLDQVQAMFEVQMPLAARAGAAMSTQNLSNTAYRQANGIR